MPIKINISDYSLSTEASRAYVAFMLWIIANPNGGTFRHGTIIFKITKP